MQTNDRTDDDSGISDVKCPPALQAQTEEIDIEEIDVKKVDHPTQTNPVENIADGAPGDESQRPGDYSAVSIEVHVI